MKDRQLHKKIAESQLQYAEQAAQKTLADMARQLRSLADEIQRYAEKAVAEPE